MKKLCIFDTDAMVYRIQELEEEVKKLEEKVAFLDCLEAAGVDNWCGYDDAQLMMEEEQ